MGCQKYFYSFIESFYLVSLLRWRGFHRTWELRQIGHLFKITSNLVECPIVANHPGLVGILPVILAIPSSLPFMGFSQVFLVFSWCGCDQSRFFVLESWQLWCPFIKTFYMELNKKSKHFIYN